MNYRVWIDFKDGTHKEQVVSGADAADALRKEWEAEGPWSDAGFALIGELPR